jgi:hypothetical protein
VDLVSWLVSQLIRPKRVLVKIFRGPVSNSVPRLYVSSAMNNVEVALMSHEGLRRQADVWCGQLSPVSSRCFERLWIWHLHFKLILFASLCSSSTLNWLSSGRRFRRSGYLERHQKVCTTAFRSPVRDLHWPMWHSERSLFVVI